MQDSKTAEAIARQRAANFYALLRQFRGVRETTAMWAHLQGTVDLDRPLSPGIATALGRFDVDESDLFLALRHAQTNLESLRVGDRTFELGRAHYPELLSRIPDAPPFIFVRGRTHLLHTPGIAVVGTRKPSPDGSARARKLAYLLAQRNITVFSGLAAGIDTNAHLGALEGGGNTVAVLGTPITKTYPADNELLQQRIGTVGALVSQFAPGTSTTRASFPIRNATMSGLALGTVVIEASETSGALIQARRCLEQNRKLFIPQSAIDNKSLSWPKKFQERGAIVFRTFGDLVSALEVESLIPVTGELDTVLAGVGGADAT